MDLQTIERLDHAAISKLTSEQYLEAHNDPTTGRAFAEKINVLENSPRQATRKAGNVRGEQAPEPQSSGFDPSFDDVPNDGPPTATPASVVPSAPVAVASEELIEKIHEYQPVDRNGRPVGGKQVFKYRTDAELIEKLTKAHSASSARIRELSRDRKLDSITAAGAAPRIQPEKEVPTTVEGLAAELRAQREQNFILSVREALNTFQLSVDWSKYRSNENAKSVVLAVERAGDDPTDPQSYHRAFHNMEQFLEPVAAAPVAATVEPTPAPAPVAPAPKAAPAVRPATTARIATGLNNDNQFNPEIEAAPAKVQGQVFSMPDGKKQVLTVLDLQRMGTDQMKRLLRSPDNARKADILWQQLEEAKAARTGGR